MIDNASYVIEAAHNAGEIDANAMPPQELYTFVHERRRHDLLTQLRALQGIQDAEYAHTEADELLLSYIDDPEVTAAFEATPRWYS